MESSIERKKLLPFPKMAPEVTFEEQVESGNSVSGEGLSASAVTFRGLTLLEAFDKLVEDGDRKVSAEKMRRGLVELGMCDSEEEAEEEARDIMQTIIKDEKDGKKFYFEDFRLIFLTWGLRCVPHVRVVNCRCMISVFRDLCLGSCTSGPDVALEHYWCY